MILLVAEDISAGDCVQLRIEVLVVMIFSGLCPAAPDRELIGDFGEEVAGRCTCFPELLKMIVV